MTFTCERNQCLFRPHNEFLITVTKLFRSQINHEEWESVSISNLFVEAALDVQYYFIAPLCAMEAGIWSAMPRTSLFEHWNDGVSKTGCYPNMHWKGQWKTATGGPFFWNTWTTRSKTDNLPSTTRNGNGISGSERENGKWKLKLRTRSFRFIRGHAKLTLCIHNHFNERKDKTNKYKTQTYSEPGALQRMPSAR